MTPERIQLRRTAGWRKPEGTVVVARPSRWGNWYKVGTASDNWGGLAPAPDAIVVWQADRRGHRTGAEWAGFDSHVDAARFAVDLHRRALLAVLTRADGLLTLAGYLGPLSGWHLGCWCALDAPCHADTLLELANRPDIVDAVDRYWS